MARITKRKARGLARIQQMKEAGERLVGMQWDKRGKAGVRSKGMLRAVTASAASRGKAKRPITLAKTARPMVRTLTPKPKGY